MTAEPIATPPDREAEADAAVEALVEEFLARHRAGERPTPEDYASAHPAHADRIRALFPVLMMMEQLKPVSADGATQPSPPLEGPPPERLGEFEILREIGRGGMGVVYEARQASLGRRVALKVLPAGARRSERQRERFAQEAAAAARLHHTNIVPVFGAGEADGVCYYAMQHIEGRGLDELLADGRLDPQDWRAAVAIGVQVAGALQYAHEQGVLHRDVKPANLLMDAGGTVWVADFGLAKLIAGDGLTRSGEIVGTLRYMAPEQLARQAEPRSDVFGLGLVLYELLTGRPAYDTEERATLIQQVHAAAPPRPRSVRPDLSRDLETIVLKAIAREPRHRYASAAALAEDLGRVLRDEPIVARRVGSVERGWRWCRRNPALALLSGTVLTLLLVVAVVASVGFVLTRRALDREHRQRTAAQRARHRAEVEQVRAEANLRLALAAFDGVFAEAARGMGPALAGDPEWPGLPPAVTPAVAAILQSLLGFYDQLAGANPADADLGVPLARAHRRVGDIQQRLGRLAEAEVAYNRALRHHRAHLETRDDARLAAVLHTALGQVLHQTGRLADASASYRAALTLLDPLIASRPTAAARLERARTRRGLATLLREQAQWRDAFGQLRLALRELLGLTREGNDSPAARHLLACIYRDLRHGLRPRTPDGRGRGPWGSGMRGRGVLGFDPLQRAIETLEGLVTAYPGEPQYRYDLAETFALAAGAERDPARALQRLHQALELSRRLTREHRDVPAFHAAQVRIQLRLGQRVRAQQGAQAAVAYYREASRAQQSLTERWPDVPGYGLYLALVRLELVAALRELERSDEALTLAEQALADLAGTLAGRPDATSALATRAALQDQIAALYTSAGHTEAARRAHAAAVADRVRLRELAPRRGGRGPHWLDRRGLPGRRPGGGTPGSDDRRRARGMDRAR